MDNQIKKETAKREILKNQMFAYIEFALEDAESKGLLDYMKIELSNHQGKIKFDHTLRDLKKVY